MQASNMLFRSTCQKPTAQNVGAIGLKFTEIWLINNFKKSPKPNFNAVCIAMIVEVLVLTQKIENAIKMCISVTKQKDVSIHTIGKIYKHF